MFCAHEMSRDCTQVSYRAVNRQESLRLAHRFEAAHRAFALPRRLMGKLGAIVRVLTRVMERVRHHLAMCGSVASEFVGDDLPRRSALLLEKPTEEPDRGCLVPPFLEQDIQDLSIPINGSKQIMLLSVDPNKDFIDKPPIAAWTRSFT